MAGVRYGDIVVCHYILAGHWFADRWFKVNATTDLDGAFVKTTPKGRRSGSPSTATSPPQWCARDAVLAGGLFLDVLVRRDGITHRVYDQREFNQPIRDCWLRPRGRRRQGGLKELTDLVERDALVASSPRLIPSSGLPRPSRRPCNPLGEVPLLQPRRAPVVVTSRS